PSAIALCHHVITPARAVHRLKHMDARDKQHLRTHPHTAHEGRSRSLGPESSRSRTKYEPDWRSLILPDHQSPSGALYQKLAPAERGEALKRRIQESYETSSYPGAR
ncbi:unnamed protein product, partial [Pylaiella littoralis]